MGLRLPKTIKMVITDFDGIVTDNCVYIDENGGMTRKLNFKDIMAFSLLRKNVIKIGIISGEANSAIEIIKNKFDIEDVHQGIRNKLEVLESIITKYNLLDYTDPATGFISSKSSGGRDLRAQELPGLWNGAMADWNTIFVDVPISTFSPVKVVQDLLRPQHQ